MKRQQGRQETIDVTEASGKTSNNICHYRKYVVLNKFEKKVNSLDVHWISNNISTSSKSTCVTYQLPLSMWSLAVSATCHLPDLPSVEESRNANACSFSGRLKSVTSAVAGILSGFEALGLDKRRRTKPTSTDLRWKAGCQQITCHVILKSGDQQTFRIIPKKWNRKTCLKATARLHGINGPWCILPNYLLVFKAVSWDMGMDQYLY